MERIHSRVSLLEYLPNEIFREILSYLNNIHTLVVFSSLNYRLQCLASKYCTSFDFKSMKKTRFDRIFQQYPTQQWKSLQLFDDDDTPGQIQYFIEQYASVKDFNQVQSLSLMNSNALDTNQLSKISSILENVVSLSIGEIDDTGIDKLNFCKLKYLRITDEKGNSWFQKLSQVESLEYNMIPQNSRYYRYLTTLLWPSILYQSVNNEIQDLITSYSTPFYTIEHNWFINCHIKKAEKFYRYDVVLYSLPFTFDELTINTKYLNECITTLPNDKNKDLYRNQYFNVKKLKLQCSPIFHEDFYQMNITELKINHYINFNQWIHIFTNLRSLHIGSNTKIWSKMFINLLNNAPHLCSLAIEKDLLRGITENWTNVRLRNSLSKKIRTLKLRFDRSSLCKSEVLRIIPFAKNCEHLSMSYVLPIVTIRFILENMRYLQDIRFKLEQQRQISSVELYKQFEEKKIVHRSNSCIEKRSNGLYQLRKYSQFETFLKSENKNENLLVN
ncbi:hypothetical protein I4U23_003983 [Adineta vaga]|nr:hypothetical protein I4U23_003983 [Adineta vaga]